MLRSGKKSGDPPVTSRIGLVLQEAHASGRAISAYLSGEGFDHIPPSGPIILWAITTGVDQLVDLTSRLGISRQEQNEVIDTLIQHGYLEISAAPRTRPTLTKRGRWATIAAMNGFRAARWAGLPLRQGDIVISSWPKTGTTWVQMICALLIFQTPELPAPLSELSPWPDLDSVSRDEAYAQLARQEHRRFMKTHLPLSVLPFDSRATYIVIGRHPLDAALSLHHHLLNQAPESADGAPHPPVRPPHSRPLMSPRESLLHWIDAEPAPPIDYLPEMLQHLSAAWARRSDPNVVLLHYEDLAADLESEMRGLAERLGITLPDAIWPGLEKAATFEHMRGDPGRHLTSGITFRDKAAFFRSGRSGEGRALLTSAELARYHALVARLAPADLLAWLHRHDGTDHI
jgi:hypothetical protein